MSAVIQIDLKDNTKDWSNTIRQQFQAAGVDARKLDQAFEALNAEMQSRSAQAYSAQIEKLSRDMTGLTAKSQAAAKSQSLFWTETMSKFNLAKEAFGWLSGGFRAASAYAKEMEENGNASFAKLNAAGAKVQAELFAIGNSPEAALQIEKLSREVAKLAPILREMGHSSVSSFGMAQEGVKNLMRGWIGLNETIDKSPLLKQLAALNLTLTTARMASGYLGITGPNGTTTKEFDEERQAQAKKDEADRARIAKELAEEERLRQKRKQAAEELLMDPGAKMRADQARLDRIAEMRGAEGQLQTEREIVALKAQQAALVKQIKENGRDPAQDDKVLANAKQLAELEQRRLSLLKEESDRRKRLIEDQAISEKRVRDDQIKGLEELLAQEKAGSKEATELEKRKAELIKRNKSEEQRLLKEKGLLEDKLARDDLARIEERARKEREAVLAGIEGERMLWAARDRRRQAEMEAEQEKVNKLKEFMQMQMGGGQGGMGGGAGGGMDFIGRLRGGIKPRDVQRELIRKREEAAVAAWREEQRAAGLMDQNGRPIDPNNRPLKGPELDGLRNIDEGHRPPQRPGVREVRRKRMVRGPNGQMIEQEEFIPLIDDQGPPAMINGGFGVGPGNDFDFGPDPRDARRMAARGRAQEAAVRQRARRQAFRDMRQGNIGNAEVADAGGALLQNAGERLIQGNRLGNTQAQAIRQLAGEAARASQADARLSDQMDQILRELAILRGGNNNGNRNQRRGN